MFKKYLRFTGFIGLLTILPHLITHAHNEDVLLTSLPTELKVFVLNILQEGDVNALGRMCCTSQEWSALIYTSPLLRDTISGARQIYKLRKELCVLEENIDADEVISIHNRFLWIFGVKLLRNYVNELEDNGKAYHFPRVEGRVCAQAWGCLQSKIDSFYKVIASKIPKVAENRQLLIVQHPDLARAYAHICCSPFLEEEACAALVKIAQDLAAQSRFNTWNMVISELPFRVGSRYTGVCELIGPMARCVPLALIEQVIALADQCDEQVSIYHTTRTQLSKEAWNAFLINPRIRLVLIKDRACQYGRDSNQVIVNLGKHSLSDEELKKLLTIADSLFYSGEDGISDAYQIWNVLASNEELREEQFTEFFERAYKSICLGEIDVIVDFCFIIAYNRAAPSNILDRVYDFAMSMDSLNGDVQKFVKIQRNIIVVLLCNPSLSSTLRGRIRKDFDESQLELKDEDEHLLGEILK